MNEDISEADFMSDGADYLKEYPCTPCADCMERECSTYCVRYDEWFWTKQVGGLLELSLRDKLGARQ